ncbi:MAG: hypothetical protein WCL57_00770 [Chloroflexota bacterium]|jgi:hypothetical protein|nr:hypothetical protein [Chloroflexota bacterium]
MNFDYVLLLFQATCLGLIVVRALQRSQHRNLFALLIPTTLLILIYTQAGWVLQQFEQKESSIIVHLTQEISLSAAQFAIQLMIGLTLAYLIAYLSFAPQTKYLAHHIKPASVQQIHYLLVGVWQIGFGFILIQTLGGLTNMINQPGQAVGGQTMLLIAISIGKLPLFYKISRCQRIHPIDIVLFSSTFLLTLFNSRFLASFILIQFLLIYNYAVREVPRKAMFYAVLALILIFIGYGLYRDNAALNPDLSVSERLAAILDRAGSDENPINWFYRTNVEGFAGLAGLLTHIEKNGPITHDLGLSNLTLFTQLIPNSLRNNPNLPFGTLASYFSSFYPYTGSVVPSGLENAYAHFGIFGILGLGILLGYLTRYLHWQLRLPTLNRLLWALLSVQVFNLIRGTFRNALFFGLADFVMCNLFMFILSLKFAHYKLHIPLRLKSKP